MKFILAFFKVLTSFGMGWVGQKLTQIEMSHISPVYFDSQPEMDWADSFTSSTVKYKKRYKKIIK